MEVERSDNQYVRPILSMFLLNSAVYFLILFGQALSAQISLKYLNAFTMLNYVCVFCQILGLALGETFYILFIGDTRVHKLRQILSGALLFYLLWTVGFVFMAFVLENAAIDFLGLSELVDAHLNYYIWIAIAFVNGLNLFFFFVIAASQTTIRLVRMVIALTFSTLLFGGLTFAIFDDPDQRFLFLSFSFLAAWSVQLLISFYITGKDIRVSLKNLSAFVEKGLKLIVGESIIISVVMVSPLLISVALDKTVGGESVGAYNVGFRIMEIFLGLQWSIAFYGISWLADLLMFRGEPEWFKCLRKINSIALVMVGTPLLAILIGLIPILRFIYELHSTDSLLIAGATLLSFVPVILTTDASCKVRLFGKQLIRASFTACLFFGISLPAVYFFGRSGLILGIAVGGLLVPNIIEGLWLFSYNKIWMKDIAPNRNPAKRPDLNPVPSTVASSEGSELPNNILSSK